MIIITKSQRPCAAKKPSDHLAAAPAARPLLQLSEHIIGSRKTIDHPNSFHPGTLERCGSVTIRGPPRRFELVGFFGRRRHGRDTLQRSPSHGGQDPEISRPLAMAPNHWLGPSRLSSAPAFYEYWFGAPSYSFFTQRVLDPIVADSTQIVLPQVSGRGNRGDQRPDSYAVAALPLLLAQGERPGCR